MSEKLRYIDMICTLLYDFSPIELKSVYTTLWDLKEEVTKHGRKGEAYNGANGNVSRGG